MVEMAALGNSRTLRPVEYPLSSLTSWSDAAAATAVGYNYPSPGPPAAHQFVYQGGRLAGGPHPYTCTGGGGTLTVPGSSCSMYSSWRHHPHSPLSFYYQSEADWILRQSKLESQPPAQFGHQQRWKVTSTDSAARDVASASSTSVTSRSVCGMKFGAAGGLVSVDVADSTSQDGSSGSCEAGLSPSIIDAWSTSARTTVKTVDHFMHKSQTQGLHDAGTVPAHTGLAFSLL